MAAKARRESRGSLADRVALRDQGKGPAKSPRHESSMASANQVDRAKNSVRDARRSAQLLEPAGHGSRDGRPRPERDRGTPGHRAEWRPLASRGWYRGHKGRSRLPARRSAGGRPSVTSRAQKPSRAGPRGQRAVRRWEGWAAGRPPTCGRRPPEAGRTIALATAVGRCAGQVPVERDSSRLAASAAAGSVAAPARGANATCRAAGHRAHGEIVERPAAATASRAGSLPNVQACMWPAPRQRSFGPPDGSAVSASTARRTRRPRPARRGLRPRPAERSSSTATFLVRPGHAWPRTRTTVRIRDRVGTSASAA